MSAKYLKTFFAEKDLDARTYSVEHNGTTHLVETGIVVELLTEQCSAAEQKRAADVIRKIDFHNGDVHDFLAHLARGYVVTNF